MFYNNKEELPILSERTKIEYNCECCGKLVETTYRTYKFNPQFLCKSCKLKRYSEKIDKSAIVLKREATCLKKYGVKNPQQVETIKNKTKDTVSKKSKEEIENSFLKGRKTILERYGKENYFQTDDFKKKNRKTLVEKYGVENYSQTDEFKNRSLIILLGLVERNQKIIDENDLEFLSINKEVKNLKFKCKTCNTEFNGRIYNRDYGIYISKCPICFNRFKTSGEEIEMSNFIENNIEIERNKKFDNKYELDCFIPSKNIGFEYDGLYWHSSLFKDDDYHVKKNEFFNSLGIRVYHIHSDEWVTKNEITKSIIKSKLNLFDNVFYARKLSLRNVSMEEERNFLDNNHIQGYISSCVCLGLYNGNDLISLMSFGKSRYNKRVEYELLRFVNKINTRVIGGASKLFYHFMLENNNPSIISYCDIRLFDGELYNKLGFEFSHKSSPNYYYVKDGEKYSRIRFQKFKLKKLFPEVYSDDKTEKDIMEEAGYCYINDCGMSVYIRNSIT